MQSNIKYKNILDQIKKNIWSKIEFELRAKPTDGRTDRWDQIHISDFP